MKIHKYSTSFFLLILTGYMAHLSALAPSGSNPNGQSPQTTANQPQNSSTQNFYINSNPSGNAPVVNPYFYTLPPPTPNEAFPDDAEQNAIYQQDLNK